MTQVALSCALSSMFQSATPLAFISSQDIAIAAATAISQGCVDFSSTLPRDVI